MSHQQYTAAGQTYPLSPEGVPMRRAVAMGKRGMAPRYLPASQAEYYRSAGCAPAGCVGTMPAGAVAASGCAGSPPQPAMYFPAGQVHPNMPLAYYYPAGAVPAAAPNFNSATPRSAWWVQGPVGSAVVNATTGYEFVRAFQAALGVTSDGNWGPTTTTAFKNYLVSRGVTGTVLNDVVRNLDQLAAGQTTTISGSTLLLAIWYTYYRNAIDLARMLGGTSEIRLGTNAMLPSVRPPPYRATAPRPSRTEGRITYAESANPPPLTGGGGGGGGGGTPSPQPNPNPVPGPNPNTPGTINPGAISGSIVDRARAWFAARSTAEKVGMGLGGAAIVAVGVWALMDDEPVNKKTERTLVIPQLPPPTRAVTAPRPIVKVNFDSAAMSGARRTR